MHAQWELNIENLHRQRSGANKVRSGTSVSCRIEGQHFDDGTHVEGRGVELIGPRAAGEDEAEDAVLVLLSAAELPVRATLSERPSRYAASMLSRSLSAASQSVVSKPRLAKESLGADLALAVRGMRGFREFSGRMAAIKAPGGSSGKDFNPRRRGNFPERQGSFCGREIWGTGTLALRKMTSVLSRETLPPGHRDPSACTQRPFPLHTETLPPAHRDPSCRTLYPLL